MTWVDPTWGGNWVLVVVGPDLGWDLGGGGLQTQPGMGPGWCWSWDPTWGGRSCVLLPWCGWVLAGGFCRTPWLRVPGTPAGGRRGTPHTPKGGRGPPSPQQEAGGGPPHPSRRPGPPHPTRRPGRGLWCRRAAHGKKTVFSFYSKRVFTVSRWMLSLHLVRPAASVLWGPPAVWAWGPPAVWAWGPPAVCWRASA